MSSTGNTHAHLAVALLVLSSCGDATEPADLEGNPEAPVGRPAPTGADAGAGPALGGPPIRDVPGPDAPEQPEEHPFVRASHDPFSTFAADVDSASYDIFVKTIEEQDGLPPSAMVRSEEFINHFRYDYPAVEASSEHPFRVDMRMGPVPGASTHLLRIGIQGRNRLESLSAANLVFLVDVSGSMSSEDKLPVAQKLLMGALDVLGPDDTLSIVTYAGRAEVALTPTPVRRAEAIRAAIGRLDAGGSTAGGDGLRMAYEQAEAGFIEGAINHIIMCTDGDFNVGPYTTEELVALVKERRAGGVTLTTLGFGLGNLNDEMMEAVSNAGNGIYRIIGGPSSASRYVEDRLLSDVVHIAKDVKLQVEFNPERIFAYRPIGYENRELDDDDFRDDVVDAGEVGSNHQITALYEVAFAAESVPEGGPDAPPLRDGEAVAGLREVGPDDLVLLKLRYKPPGAGPEEEAFEMQARLPDAPTPLDLDGESAFAWAVSTLAAQLRLDSFRTPSRLDEARHILEATTENEPRRRFSELFVQAVSRLR